MIAARARTVLLAASVAVALSACVKMRQKTVVMPDGSGKFLMTIGMGKELTDLTEKTGDAKRDPFENLASLPKESAGFVAFTRPERSEKDGFTFYSFTAYFEDVNKVRLSGPQTSTARAAEDGAAKEGRNLTFQFKKEGDGYALVIDNGLMGDSKGGLDKLDDGDPSMTPEAKEAMKSMVMEMFKGFEFSESYELPGTVTTAEGLPSKEGRVASLRVTADDLSDEKKMKELKDVKSGRRRIVCGASSVSDADLKAFHAEMAKAKADYEKWQAEEAAKKPGTPEKTEPAAPTPPAPAGK